MNTTMEIINTLSYWEHPTTGERRIYVNGPLPGGVEKIWLTDGGLKKGYKVHYKGFAGIRAELYQDTADYATNQLRNYVESETILYTFDEVLAALELANS